MLCRTLGDAVRIVRDARVLTSLTVPIPGIYSRGLPISVARPTASSTASRPGIIRIYRLSPRRARLIYQSTSRENSTAVTSTLNLPALNHWATGAVSSLGGESAFPWGVTNRRKYR